VRNAECGICENLLFVNLKKHFCFAKSASLVLQELRLKILLARQAGDSSVGLRLPQNDGCNRKQSAENGKRNLSKFAFS